MYIRLLSQSDWKHPTGSMICRGRIDFASGILTSQPSPKMSDARALNMEIRYFKLSAGLVDRQSCTTIPWNMDKMLLDTEEREGHD